MANARKSYHIAVVGATGAVGAELLRVLERRAFPVETLAPAVLPARSAGKAVSFPRRGDPGRANFRRIRLPGSTSPFSAPAATSPGDYAPIARAAGAVVIDNSSVFRMEPDVPLVIPEINGDDVRQHRGIDRQSKLHHRSRAHGALSAASRVWGAAGVRRQLSGRFRQRRAGDRRAEIAGRGGGRKTPANREVYPHPIAFNVLPHVDSFLPDGYTKEEMKMQNEGRRIMHLPDFRASVTCVRVPVYRAHSVAVSAEFERPVSVEEAHEVLAKAPGLELVDEPHNNRYPMPLFTAGKDNCEVGRVRRDCAFENGLAFWVSGDQLLKGAALNAVQIAELL